VNILNEEIENKEKKKKKKEEKNMKSTRSCLSRHNDSGRSDSLSLCHL